MTPISGCSARTLSIRSQNWRRASGSTPGRRLVEHQQIRIVDQGAAESELLFHAAGEFPGRPVQEGVEPGAPGEPVDPAAALGGAVTEKAGEKLRFSSTVR